MKDIRIGNDIIVSWSIFAEGAPYSLEGKEVTLYLCSQFGKRRAEGYAITGNQITWTFFGKEQKHSGKYSLELVVNEDAEGMVTTDACDFVNLVNCTCKVGGADDRNIKTESIELTSDMGFVPMIVDQELSETSENAIGNKTVTKELKKKVNKTDLATINGQSITEGGNIVIQGSGSNPDLSEYAKKTEVAMSLTKKVDKEEGKGLSSNDFTTTEKNKLASLANYNDSELRSEINKKQDSLISGTNIKTVNGQSILGGGNIEIKGGGGKTTVSFLDNESLQGMPFGYSGGYYKSYELDSSSIDEVDLGYLEFYYYGNIAVSFAGNFYEFKVEDLRGEGKNVGTGNIRLDDEQHLFFKPFFPQSTTIGWRIFTSRNQLPASWVEKLDELSAEVGKKADKTYVDNAIANAITNELNTEV